jgi:hypothetical protein
MNRFAVLSGALLLGIVAAMAGAGELRAQTPTEAEAKAKQEKQEKERQEEKAKWARLGRQSNALDELIAGLSAAQPGTAKVLEIDPALLEKYRSLVRAGVDGVVVFAETTEPTSKRENGANIQATISFGYWTGKDKTKLPVARNYLMKLTAVEGETTIKVTELSVVEDTEAFFAKVKAKRDAALKETETKTGREKAKAFLTLVDLDRHVGDLADAEKNFAAFKEVVNDPKIVESVENGLLSPIKISREKHKKFVEAVDAYNKGSAK